MCHGLWPCDPRSFERSGVIARPKGRGAPSGKALSGRRGKPRHERPNLSHVRWDCKDHVVILPKYRRRVFYGRLRRQIGPILRELCRQRGIELLEGHTMPDPIHLCLSIPPKYSVAFVLGFLKGKSAVRIHRELLHERRMSGLSFWAPGYCVSTVGLDEIQVRRSIREQEKLQRDQGQGEPNLD